MRILYLAGYFYPENTALTHLEKDLLEALTGAGHEIEVVCPIPTRGISEETRQVFRSRREETLYNGRVHVRRFWAPREGRNPIIRAFRYFWCNLREYQLGRRVRGAELILAISTPPTQGLLAGLLKRKLKVPFIYNLQDIFPDSMVNTGLTKRNSLLWKIGRRVEDAGYRYADKIVVISQDFRDNIMGKGVPEGKIEQIDNWINEEEVYFIPREKNALFDQYSLLRDKFYIAYSGNVGHSQNMDLLLDVAVSLRERKDIGFVIVGEGACREHVEDRIQREDISNVTLLPFQPYEDIAQVFSLGDAGLLISKSGTGSNSVPGKTWSYLSAGRPVLASFDLDSQLCRLLSREGIGVCVGPDNPEALREAVLKLADNPAVLPEMGRRGRAYIENNLTARIAGGKWLDLLGKIGGS